MAVGLGRRLREDPVGLEHLDQRRHHRRVEGGALRGPDQPEGVGRGQCGPVRPVARHRPVRLADPDDLALGGDLLAADAGRVAPTVPALVMSANDPRDPTQSGDPLERLGAPDHVALHYRPLLVVEAAGLLQDLVGHADLADVVYPGGQREVGLVVSGELEALPDRRGQAHDLLSVPAEIAVPEIDQPAKRSDKLRSLLDRRLQVCLHRCLRPPPALRNPALSRLFPDRRLFRYPG